MGEEVQQFLQDLEEVLSTRDVERVAPLYVALTPPAREALQRYFDGTEVLQVHLSDPEISLAGDTARAAFLREDTFTDKDGQRSNLTVRLVADLVRANGTGDLSSRRRRDWLRVWARRYCRTRSGRRFAPDPAAGGQPRECHLGRRIQSASFAASSPVWPRHSRGECSHEPAVAFPLSSGRPSGRTALTSGTLWQGRPLSG